MNQFMTRSSSPSRTKINRVGLWLAAAVIAYVIAVMIFIVVN